MLQLQFHLINQECVDGASVGLTEIKGTAQLSSPSKDPALQLAFGVSRCASKGLKFSSPCMKREMEMEEERMGSFSKTPHHTHAPSHTH